MSTADLSLLQYRCQGVSGRGFDPHTGYGSLLKHRQFHLPQFASVCSAANGYQHCWEGTWNGLASCTGESVQLHSNRPYSGCQSLKPSLVFLNIASYGRRRNNDVTSQEREVTMMLRHNLRTDAQICGKSATQASLFVRHGRGVNSFYCLR